MTTRDTLRCVLCGHDRPVSAFGLTAEGAYEGADKDYELSLRTDHYGGRANIQTTRSPAPLYLALGYRAALKAALARVEADIEAAGHSLDDE